MIWKELGRRTRRLLYGIRTILLGVELMLEAIICKGYVNSDRPLPKDRPDVVACWETHIRWWNPSNWVGWVRVVVFRDMLGASTYRSLKPWQN